MTTKKKTKKKVAKKTPSKAARKKTARKSKRITTAKTDEQNVEALLKKPPEQTWPWPLRPRQQLAVDAVNSGIKRLGLFWHRRYGKDVTCLSLARNLMRQRVGNYVHFFPKHVQGKRALWAGVDPRKGAKFIDIAFGDMAVNRNNTDMMIEMYNGATWQLLGSDNYDRLVGGNIVGAFFSEWALCDPRAWDYIRPMLLENNGVACFITTFRGRNHAWQMAQSLKDHPDWYIDIAGVDQTVDVDGNPIITEADIQAERDSGMSEAMIQQEYYCNPEATSDGAIYGNAIEHLRHDESRQRGVWNPSYPVYCVWNFDLPVFAAYSMIQASPVPVVLDSGVLEFTTLGDALAEVNQRRWPIQQHIIPTRLADMSPLFQDMDVTPLITPSRAAYQVTSHTQSFLERAEFSAQGCEKIIEALSGYVRRERFDPQAAVVEFGADAVMSWHWRLADTLETYAGWAYAGAGSWSKKPDYAAQDRISRVLL